jgi:hypothetical protein
MAMTTQVHILAILCTNLGSDPATLPPVLDSQGVELWERFVSLIPNVHLTILGRNYTQVNKRDVEQAQMELGEKVQKIFNQLR